VVETAHRADLQAVIGLLSAFLEEADQIDLSL